MDSGNWKIPYVVNNLVTVYKQTFWAYLLPKSNFLSFYFIFLILLDYWLGGAEYWFNAITGSDAPNTRTLVRLMILPMLSLI